MKLRYFLLTVLVVVSPYSSAYDFFFPCSKSALSCQTEVETRLEGCDLLESYGCPVYTNGCSYSVKNCYLEKAEGACDNGYQSQSFKVNETSFQLCKVDAKKMNGITVKCAKSSENQCQTKWGTKLKDLGCDISHVTCHPQYNSISFLDQPRKYTVGYLKSLNPVD